MNFIGRENSIVNKKMFVKNKFEKMILFNEKIFSRYFLKLNLTGVLMMSLLSTSQCIDCGTLSIFVANLEPDVWKTNKKSLMIFPFDDLD